MNCFRKSKLSSDSQKVAIAENRELFKELEEEIQFGMNWASFTDVNAEALPVLPPSSDAEIKVDLAELQDTEDVSKDNDNAIETEDKPVYCPDRNELLQIIKTIQKFSLFLKDGVTAQSYANHVARIIHKHFAEKCRQTTIKNYFQTL